MGYDCDGVHGRLFTTVWGQICALCFFQVVKHVHQLMCGLKLGPIISVYYFRCLRTQSWQDFLNKLFLKLAMYKYWILFLLFFMSLDSLFMPDYVSHDELFIRP